MQDDVISRIQALSRNEPIGATFTDRDENEIEEDNDDNDYVTSNEEDIKDNGSYHSDDISTINSGDDDTSDDDCPDPHFGPAPNVHEKYTGSHDTTE